MSPHGPSPQAQRPPLVRLANRIREQVLQRLNHCTFALQYQIDNLKYRIEQLAALKHRLALCQDHGFHLARGKVIAELREVLRYIPAEATTVEQRIPREQVVLSLSEMVQELKQLDEECGSWRFEPDESALVVTTDSIELEGITLGTFEIRLYLSRLARTGGSPPYTVIALEPNCPASNDAVTHPHVSDNHLCEGDASAAIHNALAQGRLCDFFILVRSVLETYNPGSPYVALDNWHGTPCHDCGTVVDDDDRYYCDGCDYDFCDGCIGSCRCCDRSLCGGCLEECSFCEERVCNRCLKRCSECGKACCESCLDDGLCPDCVDQQQADHEEQETPHDDDATLTPAGSASEPGTPCTRGGEPEGHDADDSRQEAA